MKKKELIRELLNKIWTGDYPDDNDGINQCKMDLQTVEKYIEDLETQVDVLKDKLRVVRRIFDQISLERAVTTIDEVEKCNTDYYIDYHEDGNIEVFKVEAIPLCFEGDEITEATDDVH